MERAMPDTLYNTKWFQKKAAECLQYLKAARQDPVVGPAWERARAAFARVLAQGARKPFPLSSPESEALWAETAHDRAILQECNDALFALIRERAPYLERLSGPWLWEYVVICIYGELGVEKPHGWGQRID